MAKYVGVDATDGLNEVEYPIEADSIADAVAKFAKVAWTLGDAFVRTEHDGHPFFLELPGGYRMELDFEIAWSEGSKDRLRVLPWQPSYFAKGKDVEVSGYDMHELRDQLRLMGYEGPSLMVFDRDDRLVGWVSDRKWKIA